RPLPLDGGGEAQPLAALPERRQERAAADMNEAPVEMGGEARQGVEEDVVTLFGDGAADREDHGRMLGVAAIGIACRFGRWGVARGVEAVIDERYFAGIACQRREMRMPRRRAGDEPAAIRELLPFFPLRR